MSDHRARAHPSRRQVLRGIATGALAGALAGIGVSAAATRTTVARRRRSTKRRTVGIVGGGIAGVAAAWLLDGEWDVVVFEADPILGGHAHTIAVDYRGRSVPVDVGAQFFAPGTHPSYTKLLELLGLFVPDDPAESPTITVPLSLTVSAPDDVNPLFVSPYGPDRLWPLGESWNTPGLLAFATFIDEAKRLERDDVDWGTTIEQWVEPMAIAREQKDRLIYPWLASLNNLDVEASKALSARAGVYFVSRILPENPVAGVVYYNSLYGLGGVVQRVAADCTTLTALTSARVRRIARVGRRYRIVVDDGRHELVDRLVIATPPYVAAKLMRHLPGGERVGRALDRFPYYSTTIQIHTDPIYMPDDRRLWSVQNVEVRAGFAQASVWLGAIHPTFADGATVDVFKSWARERGRDPKALVYTEDFRHPLPTPDFTQAQTGLERHQGRHGIWFVGSHCLEVDSQDTALRSAMRVADALAPDSMHYLALKQVLANATVGDVA